jgi:hydrogenase expression/formation protein HypC
MCLAAIGEVLNVDDDKGTRIAEVRLDGKTMRVGADFTPGIEPGMFVVVHAGLAMELLSAEEAADALALRAEIEAAGDS